MLEFLHHCHAGFQQLRVDRRGLSSVGRAMAALDRIPLLGSRETEAARQAVDRQLTAIMDGPSRIWIYRELELIASRGWSAFSSGTATRTRTLSRSCKGGSKTNGPRINGLSPASQEGSLDPLPNLRERKQSDVELNGIEPSASSMPLRRSPS